MLTLGLRRKWSRWIKDEKNITHQYVVYQLKKLILLHKRSVSILICVLLLLIVSLSHIWSKIDTFEMSKDKDDFMVFGSYKGIANFYINQGRIKIINTSLSSSVLSIATYCDLSLLNDAKQMALNYNQHGPVSIAIYVDKDYRQYFDDKSRSKLRKLFKTVFDDNSFKNNKYDITIGLLYFDKLYTSSLKSIEPMMLRLPHNCLRNLAERQIKTKWLLNIDIDFIYFSDTFKSAKIENTLIKLNEMIFNPGIGNKSIFIVATFEIITADDIVTDDIDINEYNLF